jgi:NAD(P)-dependent dehydrogenase (short-subunit alcohol dehydrogenase family)
VIAADIADGADTKLDVRDERAVEATVADIVAKHGKLDILVNNAGIVGRTATEEMPLELWDRIVAVNQTGVFLCARAAGRAMLKQRSGAIINLASIMGLVGGGLFPNLAYHATKGAVVNLTRALACEWSGRGVRINAIAPTFVETELTQRVFTDKPLLAKIEELTPAGRTATVQEIADAALYLASDASAMVTGHILAVDGGWLAR